MASTLATTVTPDVVSSFEIRPGTLLQFLETRAEGGPRLKCFEGRVTLVSPGRSHESVRHKLDRLVMVICLELGIEHSAVGSTTWALPPGPGDTAYEPDEAYFIQSHGTATTNQPPDLAIEVVVSNPEDKALKAGAALKIPEMWVFDIPRHKLTFYRLPSRGKAKGGYRPQQTSLAFPVLTAAEVPERLDDPETGDTAFVRNCRDWVRRVLVPRQQAGNGGA